MIKVGIDGAGSPEGGELIRLLLNHPDVELVQVAQPEYVGRDISDIHHGLVSEKSLAFSKEIDFDEVDLIFVTSSSDSKIFHNPDEFIAHKTEPESGFVIYLCQQDNILRNLSTFFLKCDSDAEDSNGLCENLKNKLVYGIPELNRKPLVRGARKAVIPTSIESLVVVALLPLIGQFVINDVIQLNMTGRREIIDSFIPRKKEIEERINCVMKEISSREIDCVLNFNYDEEANRCISLSVDFNSSSSTLDDLRGKVEQTYDDHNLAHLSKKHLSYKEVEGTDKCLIEIFKLGAGEYRVNAFIDAMLRGGAGDAIHVMNLFCGLYERTGLNLKASVY